MDRDRDRGGDRDRERDRNGRRDDHDRRRDYENRLWEGGSSSRMPKDRDDGGSMRVPNRGWDETPRARGAGGWGKPDSSRRKMGWDETPRSSRNGKGDTDDDEAVAVNGKEWEEEQVRLDRDWYSYDDEGGAVVSVGKFR